jgi:hypothetical protein
MLEAFGIIELYCNRLIEQAAQLDKPQYVMLGFITPDVIFVLIFGPLWSHERLHGMAILFGL